MKLEKIVDIYQIDPSVGPRERVIANIQVRGNRFFYLFKQFLKPYAISEVQFNVLKILNEKHPEPLSAGEISSLLISQASDVTRIIDRMILKKLVKREVPEQNRRTVLVSLTKEGLNKIKDTNHIVDQVLAKTKVWTDEEVETLNRLLDKLE